MSVFFGNGMYALVTTLDAPEWDYFAIKLRMGNGYLDTIEPYDPVPGHFDLADPFERDYATCRDCMNEALQVCISGTCANK